MYLTGQVNFEYNQFQLTGYPVMRFGLICLLLDIKDLTEGHFAINWYKVDNYVAYDNTVTELHYFRDVENYINSQLYRETYCDNSLSFVLPKNACKMQSVILFLFTDKINQPSILYLFHHSGYLNIEFVQFYQKTKTN